MPTGTPVNPDPDIYCDVSDVKRLLRGDDTNISDTDIKDIIKQKTREIEKKTVTAFRPLELTDVVVNVTPSQDQMQDTRHRRGVGYRRSVSAPHISRDRYIDVVLPTDRIRELKNIIAITDDGKKDITSNTDDWRLVDSRGGVIQIKQEAFDRTLSGKAGSNFYEGARIRIDYAYGRDDTRDDIVEATSKLVIYDLVTSDAFGDIHPDNIDQVQPDEMTERYKQDAEDIIDQYK